MEERQYCVYIMTNRSGTLYIGVTNSLVRRVREHKERKTEGFTKRYWIDRLIYYEVTGDIHTAIEREKQLKGWTRAKKRALIATMNPQWNDLTEEIGG